MQRFYSLPKFKKFVPYTMANTCNWEILKARVTLLDSGHKLVIVQVIENAAGAGAGVCHGDANNQTSGQVVH